MKSSIVTTAILALVATAASAATFGTTEIFKQEFPLRPDGIVVIDNPFGSVEVIAVEGATTVSWTAQKIVRGPDAISLSEGRVLTELRSAGDPGNRIVRTIISFTPRSTWSAQVNYSFRVPKSAEVRIAANSGDRFRVVGVAGALRVKNWNGPITVVDPAGPVDVESLNGDISVEYASRPARNAQLATVNGTIEISVPAEASFKWIGKTLKGDFLTTVPVSGKFSGRTFVGAINGAQRGPTLTTTAMTGNVFILRKGSRTQQAQSVRPSSGPAVADTAKSPQTHSGTLQRASYTGDLIYSTPLGNISVGNISGMAKVETRAGEVQLGVVHGRADVSSLGGPILLGDVFGPVTARTRAGDITINGARQGALVETGGGTIRLLYTGGPTTLRTEGGDIFVREAAGPVAAESQSGDVTVNVVGSVRSLPLDLRTAEGNVVLTLPGSFSADIEAVVMTDDPEAVGFQSELPGLSVRREQVGSRTRIRATGRLNGGGERVQLFTNDGEIRLVQQTPLVYSPR